ncbi:MAG: hypothetical protein VKO26_00015, partial [Cyanobacteriota bacterium]|nr:hypothetical protein [Cyanobacteriota bacterium]
MANEGLARASSPPGGRQRLSSAQKRAMAAIVAAVPPLLRQAYGDDLLAVVLFDSAARGTPHAHFDSDWLVVLRQWALILPVSTMWVRCCWRSGNAS